MAMDPSRNYYPLGSKAPSAVTVAIIIFLTFLSLKSVSAVSGQDVLDHESSSEMKRRVGSEPPTCVNKCFECKPCTPTLVLSHGDKMGFKAASYHAENGDSYYPLLWKCKCKHNYFEP